MNAIALANTEITQIANRCLRHVQRYGDGLSINHLALLLPGTPTSLLNQALAYLTQNEKVIHANDEWYYPVEDMQPYPTAYSINPPKSAQMSISDNEHLSVPAKLQQWFEQRDPESAQPVEIKELAELLETNTNTLAKALSKILNKLPAEKAKQLDEAVLRRKAVVRVVVSDTTEPVIAEITDVTNDECEWVTEFRNCLIAKRIPDNAHQWRETLSNMDRVFDELGIPNTHRVRHHVQEIVEWLTV